jgi:putative phosphoribosyl transferase
MSTTHPSVFEETVGIATENSYFYGTLTIPENAWGAVLFAHGSGSSRHSPRNVLVAESLHELGIATLLIDLLTLAEERVDAFTAQHRFDINLLTKRLMTATDWLIANCSQYEFRIGYFGASTGAAATLKAAARRDDVSAVVSRGGRPDLAGADLSRVKAATLLIVGGLDHPVIEMNRMACEQLTKAYRRELTIVPGATHLFEEKGALEHVARLAGQWFVRYLGAAAHRNRQNRATNGTRATHSIH